MIVRTRFIAAVAALLAACGSSPAPPAPARHASAGGKANANANASQAAADDEHGTFSRHGPIGTYVSIPWGFSTSSYVLEGPTGLVAIDTQFLPSAAEEMIQLAEAATKKKFVLAIVLHANPDKFNGTATFQKHGVKVVTSAQVKALVPAIHEKRTRAFFDRYKPDYPSEVPEPDVFGERTTEIEAAGLKLKLHVLGAGCSEAHVVVEHTPSGAQGPSIFAGDLVASGAHSWLEIGKTDEWLARLGDMRAMKPARVHPGRGPSGGASLLDDEERYLKRVMAIVAAEKPTLPVREDALARAESAIVAAYPDYMLPVFLKIGLPAEWERQARAAAKR